MSRFCGFFYALKWKDPANRRNNILARPDNHIPYREHLFIG